MSKKILYFHHAISNGGAPQSLAFLIAGLNKAEFNPIVAMPARPGNQEVKALFKNAGATVIEKRDIRPFNGSTVAPCVGLKNKAYAVLSYRKTVHCARKLVSELRPALVHLNSTCLVGAGKGAHQAGPSVPVIAHVREPLLQNSWGRMLARMNRRHVDWFVGIDQYGLDSIGLGQPRGTVIYNFVDKRRYFPNLDSVSELRSKYGWDGKVVFLSLSRVSKSNGALELACLVKKVADALPESAHFVVAGFKDSPTGYAAEAKRELERNGRCQVLGFQSDAVPLLNAADVIIAPFKTPHSARSVFEGAAIGKPSLVTNHPNLRELISEGETGLVFELNNEEGFVKSVSQLCGNVKRESMGQAALQLAGERFDSDKNVEKTMQVYRDLIVTEG